MGIYYSDAIFFHILMSDFGMEKQLQLVKARILEDPQCVHVIDGDKTPLDYAISRNKFAIAKYIWEHGGRPNPNPPPPGTKLTDFCYGEYFTSTPIFDIVSCTLDSVQDELRMLGWVFGKANVYPLSILHVTDASKNKTPLEIAKPETSMFLHSLLLLQLVKQDWGSPLRRLPDELLDQILWTVAETESAAAAEQQRPSNFLYVFSLPLITQ